MNKIISEVCLSDVYFSWKRTPEYLDASSSIIAWFVPRWVAPGIKVRGYEHPNCYTSRTGLRTESRDVQGV